MLGRKKRKGKLCRDVAVSLDGEREFLLGYRSTQHGCPVSVGGIFWIGWRLTKNTAAEQQSSSLPNLTALPKLKT